MLAGGFIDIHLRLEQQFLNALVGFQQCFIWLA